MMRLMIAKQRIGSLILYAFIWIVSVSVSESNSATPLKCFYSHNDTVENSTFPVNRDVENRTVNCSNDDDENYCFILWRTDLNTNESYIISQGCWVSEKGSGCDQSECISFKRPVVYLQKSTRFCCCNNAMCNQNYSVSQVIHTESDPSDSPPSNNSNYLMIVIAIAVIAFAFLIFCALCWRLCSNSIIDSKSKMNGDSLHLLESQSSQTSTVYDLDNLKILEVIGRGRYGSVCRGTLNEQTVAVKIFTAQHRHYYLNEKDIYMLPFMDHYCLPRLMGFQERMDVDSRLEYHLVLSYAPNGCLQEYLRQHTIDWATLCKMIQTTTQGLAYLHNEIKRGDKLKPCIAHRDLSSSNVIVKFDGSCVICDFGFAIRISGSKFYMNGAEQHAESSSLQDVGTLRYMAPEILEGAVNLRDCESAMKQIDMYALGLVLWEIASRCADLYQGVEVPAYKQPYEKEIGHHPSFEQMQVLVTRHKARPLFPDIWKDTNPAIRSLKETIDDCWDHDAEARLTALCVEERLTELPSLWERYKNGTINACVGSIYSSKTQSQNFANINNRNSLGLRCNNFYNIGFSSHDNSGTEKLKNEIQNIRYRNDNSNSTEETTVSFSPSNESEKNVQLSVNAFLDQPKLTLPLQPHQGRNPCLERNLMSEVSDDDNTKLLEHGLKFQNHNTNSGAATDLFYEFNSNNNNDSNPIVNREILGHNGSDNIRSSRRIGNTPIPYVQNAVGISTIPKRPNVPGNGHDLIPSNACHNYNNVTSENISHSRLSKLLNWTKAKGFKSFSGHKKRNDNNDINSIDESRPFASTHTYNSTMVVNPSNAHLNTMISSVPIDTDTVISETEPKSTENTIKGVPFNTFSKSESSSRSINEPFIETLSATNPHHQSFLDEHCTDSSNESNKFSVKESSFRCDKL